MQITKHTSWETAYNIILKYLHQTAMVGTKMGTVSDGDIVPPASDEILELMFSTCSRKCTVGSCPCIDNSLMCTDACTKKDC